MSDRTEAARENLLYEKDFCEWTQEQARLLRERRFADLDLDNLIGPSPALVDRSTARTIRTRLRAEEGTPSPMLRATSVLRRAAVKPERVADTLELDHEARHRRRVALTGQGGLAFLLDLDRATVLEDGDAVKLEDGRLVQIKAAPERLIEVRTENLLRLTKVAWHIGNRHVAAEITADAIYIAHDHVLLEMIRGLGAAATIVERPFRPERGAYHEHGPDCGHDHGGGHGHDHHADHGHGHRGGHDHAHGHHAHHAHEHGPDCGCGHDHGHGDAHDDHQHGAKHGPAHAHHG